MADIISLTRIVIGLAFLSVAAVSDWRTRQVSNKVWLLMGGLGMAVLAWEMSVGEHGIWGGGNPVFGTGHFLVFIPVAILFLDVFWDREPVLGERLNPLPILFYIIALVGLLSMLWLEGPSRTSVQLLTIPLLIVVAYVFYFTGLLHGGADAKAFMSLAILLPFYPTLEGLPMIDYDPQVFEVLELTFPFAFLVLMNAAIIQVITVPFGLLVKNAANKDFGFPEMLLGYRMDLDEIPKRFVWPMEVVREDEIVLRLFPRRDADLKGQLVELRERGLNRIWVTPKVPFMVPILLGLLFSILVGNVVMLLF